MSLQLAEFCLEHAKTMPPSSRVKAISMLMAARDREWADERRMLRDFDETDFMEFAEILEEWATTRGMYNLVIGLEKAKLEEEDYNKS